jgi:hypothetical protein
MVVEFAQIPVLGIAPQGPPPASAPPSFEPGDDEQAMTNAVRREINGVPRGNMDGSFELLQNPGLKSDAVTQCQDEHTRITPIADPFEARIRMPRATG